MYVTDLDALETLFQSDRMEYREAKAQMTDCFPDHEGHISTLRPRNLAKLVLNTFPDGWDVV